MRLLERASGRVGREVLDRWLGLATPSDYVRLGTEYGGWWVPDWILQSGNLAYCAGVGEDLSFDRALVERGLSVVAFDPTPRAVEYAASVDLGPQFEFEPLGWWDEAAQLAFFAPRDAQHASYSALNLQHTHEYVLAEVDTVDSIMRRRGDPVPQLIKMDVEGAEFRILRSMVRARVLPTVLCVEFDQPAPWFAVRLAITNLVRAGYEPKALDRWTVTFVLLGADG